MENDKRVQVKSLTEYVDIITSLNDAPIEVGCTQKKLVFRGLSNAGYKLVPSIQRYPSEHIMNSLVSKELDLIEQAQLRFPNAYSDAYPVLRLAKLQHYGIPTRMMDVTTNALVALYFACQNSKDNANTAGEVVVFSDYMYTAFSSIANAIADTATFSMNAYMSVKTYFFRVSQQPYYVRRKYPDDSKYQGKVLERFCNALRKPVIVDVGNITERQKYQQGKFIVFPNEIRKIGDDMMLTDDLVELPKESDMVVKRILVDKDSKEEILLQLQRFGITKDFLFSDSMDIVNNEIVEQVKRLYTCEEW